MEVDREDFAQLLGRHRQREGLSLGALAQRADLPKATIQDWLEGQVRRPRDWQRVLRLAAALNLSADEADELLRLAGHPPHRRLPLERLREPRLHPEARVLLDRWLDRLAASGAAAERDAHEAAAQPGLSASCHQLRAPVADFVGRAAEIQAVLATLQTAFQSGRIAAAISGVQGMGGVGKTELAYVVAQELRDTFPDAQIVLQLQGASLSPLTPEQALQNVIRAFTPEATLPDDIAALEGLYRTQLHARRVLILADDARDAAQVRPLLPPPGCALLVTSRQRFNLPGMVSLALEQLPPEAASTLVRAICPRMSPEEAAALARACGYLPLALRVSAGILHNDPALPVPAYLDRLADDRQRLALLSDPDDPQLDVAAALALSYALLDRPAQAVFRQLGVFVADFSTELAAQVMEAEGPGDAAEALRGLLRRNLVQYEPERARWRLHDLVRDLARQRLETAGEAEAAERRYARAAVRLAAQIQERYLAGGDTALLALAQFDAERPHIDAAQSWAERHVETPDGDQLLIESVFAARFIGLIRYDRRQRGIPHWEGARRAAQRLGDRATEARALGNLGLAHHHLGEPHRAVGYHEQALVMLRELGNRRGEAMALLSLGMASQELGRPQTAIGYLEQSLAAAGALGDRALEGQALGSLSLAYRELGELRIALGYAEQDLAIARELGDRHSEGTALGNLGCLQIDLGDTQRGRATCAAAVGIAQAIGDLRQEGASLGQIARVEALQGATDTALASLTRALALLHDSGDRWAAAEARWWVGLALAQQGAYEHALAPLRAAVAYQQEIGHARAAERAALLPLLEAGEALPPALRTRLSQQGVSW
jgi:tetratricopeptide (TPR) repeat protein/transcriptional regulator with XRE-family HTH domain